MGNQQPSHHRLPMPYEAQISPPISLGSQFHISGTASGSQFEVNLANHRGDVVFHVNPRFQQNALILNSAPGGNWGSELRENLATFKMGSQFTLIIMVTEQGFKLAVNNQHLCDFPHRMSYQTAEIIQVKGEVNLSSVQMYPGYGTGWNFQMDKELPVNMFPGRVIQISGVPTNQSRFEFNLLSGYNDIAFHFNPRFDSRTAVRNSSQGGNWANEETGGGFPFQAGQPFEMQIICFEQYYQVIVNNQPWFQFAHRQPYQQVRALQAKGDVQIYSVRVM